MAASGLVTVRTISELRACINNWRSAGEDVGLVPTMGALHEGHLALVRASKARTARTVVTLFVNPKQFGPNEDYGVYPRDEARDAALVAAEGADLLFAPDVSEVYPDGHATQVHVGGLGDVLEGAFRPGFFTGVATVVSKLLIQSLPDKAFFGEKDFQQLQVIKRLIRDLHIPVEAVGVETVREADGLALSSRNAYLDEGERAVAPVLYGALQELSRRVAAGEAADAAEKVAVDAVLRAGFQKVDYIVARDADALSEPPVAGRPGRVLAAAWLGRARLIDNVPI